MSLNGFSSTSWIGFMRCNKKKKNIDYLQPTKQMDAGRLAS
jgi:hypothetical protein